MEQLNSRAQVSCTQLNRVQQQYDINEEETKPTSKKAVDVKAEVWVHLSRLKIMSSRSSQDQ